MPPVTASDASTFLNGILVIYLVSFIHVFKSILDQCKVDLFLLDWEQSKTSSSDNLYEQPKSIPVSVWRSIFMSNEWAALQTYRYCNVEFTLLAVLVLLEGTYLGNFQEQLVVPDGSGNRNPVLIYCIDSLCWLLVIVAQKLVRYMFYDRFYRNKISQFSDILSLANISFLILNEKFHGYYIHGKSVHATADTSMEELNACLLKEAADMVPRRGLGPSNQLNFELFVTPDFRNVFDGIYRPSEGETARTMTMMNKLTLNDGTSPKFQEYKSPIGSTTNHLVRTYRMMTKFLHSFFEMNLKDFGYVIKKKTPSELIFGANADTSKGSVLYHDDLGITNCVLLGIENHMLILYFSLFTFFHIITANSLMGALAVWIVEFVLTFIRTHYGEKNIAQKSLLDPKFLI